MFNFYRRIVPNFARIAAPLNRQKSKYHPFELGVLTDSEYTAFAELKKRLVSPPIFALPRHGLK